MEYSKICFVVMPFGMKPIGQYRVPLIHCTWPKKVNFDQIYEEIFAPAISQTPLPEGGTLEPRRTDHDLFSSDISQDMFDYLEYSRMVLTDISSPNENVFYELGVRHRSRSSGTAIFRQSGAFIPFDINHIKAFPYDYRPSTKATSARKMITRVLSESLINLRLDSPIIRSLQEQQKSRKSLDYLLKDGESALLAGDRATAICKWSAALAGGSGTAVDRVRLGILYRDQSQWGKAAVEFEKATLEIPNYAEAHRELGIAQNKLALSSNGLVSLSAAAESQLLPGEHEIIEAIRLNPDDFDATASLGGIYKRANNIQDAIEMYKRSTATSCGHPYPLLNLLKLQAEYCGTLKIDNPTREKLKRAERFRAAQVKQSPSYDSPWCHFDLAEIRLFLGASTDEITQLVERGIAVSVASWQVETFYKSLRRLQLAGIDIPAIHPALNRLQKAIAEDNQTLN